MASTVYQSNFAGFKLEYYTKTEHVLSHDGVFGSVTRYVLSNKNEQVDLPESVIVKRVSLLKSTSSDNLIEECAALKKLSHRNVHKVYYWATTPKHFLYIYTEECDHNLQDLIDCDWFALTLNGIRSIAIQTCEGLNFLHSRNFVHGNVNCRSILVKWNRGMKRIGKIENAEVKLAYCNLDRFVRKRDSAVKINRFDAPEIAAAKFGRMKDFRQTKESDIFSLGVALHVAAEKGKFPFTIKELLQRGLSPTTENRRGKDSIFGVIFSMLSWKAEERPKAAEAAQDFLLGVIQIRRMSGETYPLLVRLRDSVGETKRKIEKEEKFLLASVRIVFAGIELQNEDEKLCNCGINFEDIIDIIVV